MTSIEQFVVSLVGVLFPWLLLAVQAKFFLRAGNRHLQTIDDLTAQVVAFKNPWAAEMFGKMKADQAAAEAREQEHMNKDPFLESRHEEADLI